MPEPSDRFRALPAVHQVLLHPTLIDIRAVRGDEIVVDAIRKILSRRRTLIASGESTQLDLSLDRLARETRELLDEQNRSHLRFVINATGILLHTGLGRAPLSKTAIDAISRTAAGYCNLEFDLATGERGHRTSTISRQLCKLTGAEAATVVNNNAAATVLVLKALASAREVVVSRGELIEIGGSFRLPEIFEVSGARLREIGTTNKVRLADYHNAINDSTAALLKVHPSNYRIVGFSESVGIAAIARLAHDHNLLAIDDIGSGALASDRPPGLLGEPTIAESLAGGADVVLCSGDKLLGGPQCGLILGRESLVQRIESDPLMRALRVDKLTLAALEATLHAAALPSTALPVIPLWRFLATSLVELQHRAERLARELRHQLTDLGLQVEATASESYLGGGSLPTQAIPSWAMIVSPVQSIRSGRWLMDWATRLRQVEPSVIATIRKGSVWFDLRAIDPAWDDQLLEAIRQSLLDRSACGSEIQSVS